MEYAAKFISFCNTNYGVFSLLVSIVAIVISLKAIKSGNKSAMLEKRLSLYCQIESIYYQCKKITERCKKITERCAIPCSISTKRTIMAIIFDLNSKEYDVLEKAINIESQRLSEKDAEKLTKQQCELCDEYAELYLKTMNPCFEARVKLLFSNKKAVENALELYRLFDNLKLSLIAYQIDELEKTIQEMETAVKKFEDKRVLKYLKRDLPL